MPLDVDVAGNIRHLYLLCWRQRNSLYKIYNKDESGMVNDNIAEKGNAIKVKAKQHDGERILIQGINTLLAIIARVFKQGGKEYERDLKNDLDENGLAESQRKADDFDYRKSDKQSQTYNNKLKVWIHDFSDDALPPKGKRG